MYIQKNTYFCSNFEVMRRILGLLLVVFLMGCEKYEQPSSILQQLSGPTPFYLKSYRIQIQTTNEKDDIGMFVDAGSSNTTNYIGLGDWYVINRIGNRYVIRCDTTSLIAQRKYVIGDQWNFGNPDIYGLKIFDNLRSRINGVCEVYEGGSSSAFIYPNLLEIRDSKSGMTDYGFSASTNSRGVSYATELYLTTPKKWFYVKEGQRVIGRFNYSIELLFNRN